MLAVGKHVVLARQVRATRIDQVDTGQVVLRSDRLRAQVFFYRNRVVSAAFDRRVIGDDHAFETVDPADAANQSTRGNLVFAVKFVTGELADFEKRRAGVDQPIDAIARQQLAAVEVFPARTLTAAVSDPADLQA